MGRDSRMSGKKKQLINKNLVKDIKLAKKPYTFPIATEDNLIDGTDLNKLAVAVAWAETGNGKYAKNFNYWGIMYWPKGKRTQKKYASYEEGKEDFKKLWREHYKTFPTYRLAAIYTGNDNPTTWLKHVKYYYNK